MAIKKAENKGSETAPIKEQLLRELNALWFLQENTNERIREVIYLLQSLDISPNKKDPGSELPGPQTLTQNEFGVSAGEAQY